MNTDKKIVYSISYRIEMNNMIQDYLDILESCNTRYEKEAVLKLVADEARDITIRELRGIGI